MVERRIAHGVMQETCFAQANGSASSVCATSFPIPSALATSWNDTLFYQVATIVLLVDKIARYLMSSIITTTTTTLALNFRFGHPWSICNEIHDGDATKKYPARIHYSHESFCRPIWYVKGLQQVHYHDATATTTTSNNSTMQMAACCKHFVANSLEHWQNVSRHSLMPKSRSKTYKSSIFAHSWLVCQGGKSSGYHVLLQRREWDSVVRASINRCYEMYCATSGALTDTLHRTVGPWTMCMLFITTAAVPLKQRL